MAMGGVMLYDLLRDAHGYHLYPRGTAHAGVFICTVTEWFALEMGWLPT